MFIFSNKYRSATVWLPSKKRVQFDNHMFRTEDKELAQEIREHPLFGKEIIDSGEVARKQKENIIRGVITSANSEPISEDEKVDYTPYVRLGFLKAKVLKKDGGYVKGMEEEIKEYEILKEKLGDY